jgi:sterol desaturase/sphingolipid hydroxylase (fatty acid hydroxylase superfamily)
VPPGFSFSFFLTIPGGLVAIICSKIVYVEPLVLEVILWHTLAYWFEIFNHSIVHYSFANNNIFIRFFSNFFGGNGVYHLMHHSAKETDQIINLGGGPLLIWDRVFRTYKKPYNEAPPLGLTNQPKMILNPFRIIFSGIAQLIYEWKNNSDWFTRAKIIFGDIYYVPPMSKDFLVPAYNKKTGIL